jgi:hypothetical protein
MAQINTFSDSLIIKLAERLRNSAENLSDPKIMSGFDEESLCEALKPYTCAERYLHEKAKAVSEITGIENSGFPPAGKLTETRAEFLFSEMR